jgi:hypothetical protein
MKIFHILEKFNNQREKKLNENNSNIISDKKNNEYVLFTKRDINEKINTVGVNGILGELTFILNEIAKDPDSVDMKKLAKCFSLISSMDVKLNYFIEFLIKREIKPGSTIYKIIRDFFLKPEHRAIFDEFINFINIDSNYNSFNNNMIDYSELFSDGEIVITENIFANISSKTGISIDNIINLYSLNGLSAGTLTGNGEILMICTGNDCKFAKGNQEDLKINNKIIVQVKGSLNGSKSSAGRIGGLNPIFKNGATCIDYISHKVKNFIKAIVKNMNCSPELTSAIYEKYMQKNIYFSINPNYKSRDINGWIAYSIDYVIYDLAKIIYEYKVNNNSSADSTRISDIIMKKALGLYCDIYSNAWTTIPNQKAADYVKSYFNSYIDILNTPNPVLWDKFNEFVEKVGLTYLEMAYAGTRVTHLAIFSSAAEDASLTTIPIKKISEFINKGVDGNIQFILPSTVGRADRRATWGIL